MVVVIRGRTLEAAHTCSHSVLEGPHFAGSRTFGEDQWPGPKVQVQCWLERRKLSSDQVRQSS